MPGIDFDRLRAEITMEEVLNLIGFQPARCAGHQWHGRCPLHESSSQRTPFSVNVASKRYYCHRCYSHGNHLELWAAAIRQPEYRASIDLCGRLGRDVPWIHRW